MNYMEMVSETILDYIAFEGINVTQFAKRIGKSQTVVWRWLKGQKPDTLSAIQIADFLKISLDYLFGLTDMPGYVKGSGEKGFLERFTERKRTTHLTNYAVARICKISNSTISKWYTGQIPKPETLIELARCFNCSLDYLVGRSDSV